MHTTRIRVHHLNMVGGAPSAGDASRRVLWLCSATAAHDPPAAVRNDREHSLRARVQMGKASGYPMRAMRKFPNGQSIWVSHEGHEIRGSYCIEPYGTFLPHTTYTYTRASFGQYATSLGTRCSRSCSPSGRSSTPLARPRLARSGYRHRTRLPLLAASCSPNASRRRPTRRACSTRRRSYLG